MSISVYKEHFVTQTNCTAQTFILNKYILFLLDTSRGPSQTSRWFNSPELELKNNLSKGAPEAHDDQFTIGYDESSCKMKLMSLDVKVVFLQIYIIIKSVLSGTNCPQNNYSDVTLKLQDPVFLVLDPVKQFVNTNHLAAR